jgi:hypothetical protein
VKTKTKKKTEPRLDLSLVAAPVSPAISLEPNKTQTILNVLRAEGPMSEDRLIERMQNLLGPERAAKHKIHSLVCNILHYSMSERMREEDGLLYVAGDAEEPEALTLVITDAKSAKEEGRATISQNRAGEVVIRLEPSARMKRDVERWIRSALEITNEDILDGVLDVLRQNGYSAEWKERS